MSCLSEISKPSPLDRLPAHKAPSSRGAPSLPTEAPAPTIATCTKACRLWPRKFGLFLPTSCLALLIERRDTRL